jgi:hypothetical protein
MSILPNPPTPSKSVTIAASWRVRATLLADWTEVRLVNRADVWGGYYPVGGEIARTTHPARLRRGQVLLTRAVLEAHFRALRTRDVIGLHTTSPDNLSLWGALDLDMHEGSTVSPEVNFRAARFWYDRLVDLRFGPLLTDSNGKGGFHLLPLFSCPVSTLRVFAFLQWLTADHARHGLTARPETFPKQPWIAPGKYGNWLRVPGRHHSSPHWSRVWDGGRWLEGSAAALFILALKGDSPDLIPTDLVLPTIRKPDNPSRRSTFVGFAASGNLGRRIQGRLNKLPNRAAGQCRHGVAFNFACWLVRDLALSDEVAMPWLERWDAKNTPPLGESELREVLRCAREYGQSTCGCGLESLPPAPGVGARKATHAVQHLRFEIEV